jgi:hypothetical protein
MGNGTPLTVTSAVALVTAIVVAQENRSVGPTDVHSKPANCGAFPSILFASLKE